MRRAWMLVACGLMGLGACGSQDDVGVSASADAGAGASGDIQGEVASATDGGQDALASADAQPDTALPTDISGAPDVQSADGAASQDAGSAGTVSIYLTGDLTAQAFQDGLAGQTPTDFEIALSRYHILKSADDPAPVLCFDHGKGQVVAALSKDTLVGTCPTAALPTGSYSHGRVKVLWSRYTVAALLHSGAVVLPGTFTFLRAWSDTMVEGKFYQAGQGTVTFKNLAGVAMSTVPNTYPSALPMTGVSTKTVGGEFLMTFAWTHALPVVQGGAGAHWARFHWHTHDGFRWKDTDVAGHKKGAWDVWSTLTGSEEVVVAGVTGYHVTSSVD